MTIHRLVNRTANEAQYADPTRRFNTTRVRVDVQPKKAGALTVYNAKSSIKLQRTVKVAADVKCDDVCNPNEEKLALGFYVSGSVQSAEAVDQMCEEFLLAFAKFRADMRLGFLLAVDQLDLTVTTTP